MSFQHCFDNPEPAARLDLAPIVLRFAQLFPRDLKRREMHRKRKGGDLSHIRHDLTGLNHRWVGHDGWIDEFLQTVETAARENLHNEIEAREAKRRWSEVERVKLRGLVDPWKFTSNGPLREGILTVNKRWFGGTGIEEWDPERVAQFMDRVLAFLREHFPNDQLLEVDSHVDEESFHVHFVVATWTERFSQNRGRQVLLQASANPLIQSYEHAQDVAGEAFLDLGIHRGEQRAAAAREARCAGLEAPSPRRHITPSKWREAQRLKALDDRDFIRTKARAEAAQIRADAGLTAKASVKKSRKRAIAEARERKAEADQLLIEARIGRSGERMAGAFRRSLNAKLAERAEALYQKMAKNQARLGQMDKHSQELAKANAQAEQDLIATQQAAEKATADAAAIIQNAQAAERDALLVVQTTLAEREAATVEIAVKQQELAQAHDLVLRKDAELTTKLSIVDRLLQQITPLLLRMTSWMRRADLPAPLKAEAAEILQDSQRMVADSRNDFGMP